MFFFFLVIVKGSWGVATCNFANNATLDFAHMADDFWVTISELCQALLGPSLHEEESGPIFNPNPPFLLVQKLKSAPPKGFTIWIQG